MIIYKNGYRINYTTKIDELRESNEMIQNTKARIEAIAGAGMGISKKLEPYLSLGHAHKRIKELDEEIDRSKLAISLNKKSDENSDFLSNFNSLILCGTDEPEKRLLELEAEREQISNYQTGVVMACYNTGGIKAVEKLIKDDIEFNKRFSQGR